MSFPTSSSRNSGPQLSKSAIPVSIWMFIGLILFFHFDPKNYLTLALFYLSSIEIRRGRSQANCNRCRQHPGLLCNYNHHRVGPRDPPNEKTSHERDTAFHQSTFTFHQPTFTFHHPLRSPHPGDLAGTGSIY